MELDSGRGGIWFGENQDGVTVMKVPTNSNVEIENLAEAIEFAVNKPNSDQEIKAGMETPQYVIFEHAVQLCRDNGYDQSKRRAWFSENKDKLWQFALLLQGIMESTTGNEAPAHFVAHLYGGRFVKGGK